MSASIQIPGTPVPAPTPINSNSNGPVNVNVDASLSQNVSNEGNFIADPQTKLRDISQPNTTTVLVDTTQLNSNDQRIKVTTDSKNQHSEPKQNPGIIQSS